MTSVDSEVYRGSAMGVALIDSLDEFVRANVVPEELARHILTEFDRVMAEAIVSKVKARATVKAHLKTYRLCEDVWYFNLRNATFKMDDKQTVSTGKINVIAVKNGDVPPDSEAGTPQTSPSKRYK
ncbi:transcription initiation factor IIA gamma subunit [Mycena vulgaris]|nr:transcription initiation factor IIA gamma subunit [Mycena vulgaris]